MDKSSNSRQQIVEKIKAANNLLLVVSNNPTVDQLATCIGMALMFNKLKKHAVAVYSGDTPSALEFLKPEETIEKTTDSLQDFIISLDRAKADKLRYKVENDVVKIFISPYRTGITEEDLQFSQGDLNVDVVIAIGVDDKDHLDNVIVSHGQILHDAIVTSMMAGSSASTLGSINWQDESASSLAEMAVKISESLKPDVLDAQMATAFLTGLVAETERFKNQRTNSKVMNIAAQLVAAGANPQLVAENLEGLVASIIEDGQEPAAVGDDQTIADELPPPLDSARPAEIITLNTNEEVKDINLRDEEAQTTKKIDYIHIDQNGRLSRVDDQNAPAAATPASPSSSNQISSPTSPQSHPLPPAAVPPKPPSAGVSSALSQPAPTQPVAPVAPPPSPPPSAAPPGVNPTSSNQQPSPPSSRMHRFADDRPAGSSVPQPQQTPATPPPSSSSNSPPTMSSHQASTLGGSTSSSTAYSPNPTPNIASNPPVSNSLASGRPALSPTPSAASGGINQPSMAPPPLLPPPPTIPQT